MGIGKESFVGDIIDISHIGLANIKLKEGDIKGATEEVFSIYNPERRYREVLSLINKVRVLRGNNPN